MKEYENLDDYINYYKELSLKDKRMAVIDELKLLAASMNQACSSLGVKNEIVINRELVDINKEDYSEDDYNEAVMVWLCSIQDSFCDLLEGLTDITDKL